MGTPRNPTRPVKTAQNIFKIIDNLNEKPGSTNQEIAEAIGLAPSTTHSYLSTMSSHEYIKSINGRYYLGLKFLDYGIKTQDQVGINQAVFPAIQELADETNSIVWIIVEELGKGVYLYNSTGKRGIRTSGRVGKRTHLHCLAAGKAILAHMDEAEVDQIIETHGLPDKTEYTITNREELMEELAQVRERGVAYNNQEEVTGIRAIGAPIFKSGQVVAGVSLSGPVKRMTQKAFEESVIEEIQGVANEIELLLEYHSEGHLA